MLFDIESYLRKALSLFEGRETEAHWETEFSWFEQARRINSVAGRGACDSGDVGLSSAHHTSPVAGPTSAFLPYFLICEMEITALPYLVRREVVVP